ncbi:uncharacterized protein BT62DRAFT_1013700 [Guyanagaster necrorhizus]|uniref:Uncharacterized protein n=1 Tax=Guyanagaster necrorhizus TaxID=856835 RepID=A0A9P8ALH3_9AGAR|nr:uncharacterized protein BT62DRAFT_1013700 [Guyanagaster necrorhizus MCA 3950]KAG7439641.1 hypothetical protein BT62DRAFT_1013700 [Guyanagaster necrorhizus MCA 3950]
MFRHSYLSPPLTAMKTTPSWISPEAVATVGYMATYFVVFCDGSWTIGHPHCYGFPMLWLVRAVSLGFLHHFELFPPSFNRSSDLLRWMYSDCSYELGLGARNVLLFEFIVGICVGPDLTRFSYRGVLTSDPKTKASVIAWKLILGVSRISGDSNPRLLFRQVFCPSTSWRHDLLCSWIMRCFEGKVYEEFTFKRLIRRLIFHVDSLLIHRYAQVPNATGAQYDINEDRSTFADMACVMSNTILARIFNVTALLWNAPPMKGSIVDTLEGTNKRSPATD